MTPRQVSLAWAVMAVLSVGVLVAAQPLSPSEQRMKKQMDGIFPVGLKISGNDGPEPIATSFCKQGPASRVMWSGWHVAQGPGVLDRNSLLIGFNPEAELGYRCDGVIVWRPVVSPRSK